MDDGTQRFGIYVHIPFCARRCDYCAFAAWDDREGLIPRYLAGLAAEVARERARGLPAASSVFVGGGTPSLVSGTGLVSILSGIERAPGAEVTVECNPETVTDELLATYAEAGVNRLSFGVQSMVPHVLDSLGRAHRPDTVASAVAAARRQGLASFSLDLIYGAAGESVADWGRTLDGALTLEPSHVSAYALTVEPGTPLAADAARHPDDDDQATKYELANEQLTAAGLGWYEISNWARPGYESSHNLLYWTQGEYLGLGCSAHSHRDGVRWWNVRTPERYLDLVEHGASVRAGEESLAPEASRLEALQLGLRTRRGVPVDAVAPADLNGDLAALLAEEGDRLVLTTQGRLLANEVAIRLR